MIALVGRDLVCSDCGHLLFDHACDIKRVLNRMDDARMGACLYGLTYGGGQLWRCPCPKFVPLSAVAA
jgi:hypothetical protein